MRLYIYIHISSNHINYKLRMVTMMVYIHVFIIFGVGWTRQDWLMDSPRAPWDFLGMLHHVSLENRFKSWISAMKALGKITIVGKFLRTQMNMTNRVKSGYGHNTYQSHHGVPMSETGSWIVWDLKTRTSSEILQIEAVGDHVSWFRPLLGLVG